MDHKKQLPFTLNFGHSRKYRYEKSIYKVRLKIEL